MSIYPNKIPFMSFIFKKIKYSIDKPFFYPTFTAETKEMNFNATFFYGYYFYFTSKSRD